MLWRFGALVIVGWLAALPAAHSADLIGAGANPVSAAAAPTVDLPDLAFTPTKRDVADYDEYFLFNKPGVSQTAARADIEECASYSMALRPMGKLALFVPVGGNEPSWANNREAYKNAFVMYGLVGVAIFAWVSDDLSETNTLYNTRRCLGYKGYLRYGTTRTIWKALHKGEHDQVIARLAAIASGATPPGEVLEP